MNINIAVDEKGQIYWNGQPVSCEQFKEKLHAARPKARFEPLNCTPAK